MPIQASLTDKIETNYPDIEIINRQTDLVPKLAERYRKLGPKPVKRYEHGPVDLINIATSPGMRTSDFHTYEVEVRPPLNHEKLREYSKRVIRDSDFIFPLVHHNLLASIYHYNPRDSVISVTAYKESSGLNVFTRTLKTEYVPCFGGHHILWKQGISSDIYLHSLRSKTRSAKKVAEDINKSSKPLVVNISLDSFHYLGQEMREEIREEYTRREAEIMTNQFRKVAANWQCKKNYLHYSSEVLLTELTQEHYIPKPEECGEIEYMARMNRVLVLLKPIRQPDLIVISRSQEPLPKVPPDKLNILETMVLDGIHSIYQES